MSPGVERAVRRLLARAVRAGTAPGIAAGWRGLTGGETRTVAVGRAAVRPMSEALTEDHRFDLASLTKPMVVTPLVCLLLRNDVLSLETTLGDALPELSESPLGRRRIRHLLTHTSGLPAWEPIYVIAGSSEAGDVARAIGALAVGEVGREVIYSCPGFIVLGLVLERLTSTPLDVLFMRLVLEPLGLDAELGYRPRSGLPIAAGSDVPSVEQDLVIERGLGPESVPAVGRGMPDDGNARFLGGVSGNAGLFGTIRGVLGLATALAVPGALLTEDEIRRTTRNHTSGLGQSRGLGWQLADTKDCSAGAALAPSSFGHTGFTGTSLWVDPSRGVAMALLSNRNHPGQRLNDLHPLRRRFHRIVVDHL